MKYVPGPMFGQFSRSQGNTTASHNRFGSYTRNRVIPADPATAKQLAQRALIQDLSEAWRLLTQVQRDGWATLGDQMTRLDTQGQSYTLTPLQAFTSINSNLSLIGETLLDDAPVLDVPANIYSFALAGVAGITALTVTSAVSLAATEFLVVEATAMISAGINFQPRSNYKFLERFDSVDVSPFDILATYEAIYGSLLEGTKIFARTRVINDAGFDGSIVKDSAIVAA